MNRLIGATLVGQRRETRGLFEKEHKMARFMEMATIEQTLIEDRDEYLALAEEAFVAGLMDKFTEFARKYHEIAGVVGYPEAYRTH